MKAAARRGALCSPASWPGVDPSPGPGVAEVKFLEGLKNES